MNSSVTVPGTGSGSNSNPKTQPGDQVLYREVQRFTQWWLWVIIVVPPCILLFTLLTQSPEQLNRPGQSKGSLVFAVILTVGLPILFCFTRLITEVRGDGVYVRFIPFHGSFVPFRFDELTSAEIRCYKPIREYGGWGLRYGFRSGKAYNVRGNMGLQLVLKDGKKVLIGTHDPKGLEKALKTARERK